MLLPSHHSHWELIVQSQSPVIWTKSNVTYTVSTTQIQNVSQACYIWTPNIIAVIWLIDRSMRGHGMWRCGSLKNNEQINALQKSFLVSQTKSQKVDTRMGSDLSMALSVKTLRKTWWQIISQLGDILVERLQLPHQPGGNRYTIWAVFVLKKSHSLSREGKSCSSKVNTQMKEPGIGSMCSIGSHLLWIVWARKMGIVLCSLPRRGKNKKQNGKHKHRR